MKLKQLTIAAAVALATLGAGIAADAGIGTFA